ncbi:MAG: peptide ABC transporter substrate-binding protein [Stackebrandtia sp.]
MTDLPPPDYHKPGPGHNPYGAPDPYTAADPVQPVPHARPLSPAPQQHPPEQETEPPPIVDPRVGFVPLPLPEPGDDPGGPKRLKWLIGGGVGFVAVAVTVVIALVVASGPDAAPNNPGAAAVDADISVGTLTPPSLLTGDGGDERVDAVLQPLFSGLTRTDPSTGHPENLIAEEISTKDAVTWTITLKTGYTFHNGEPVTSDSFVDAWNLAAAGENDMDGSLFFERIAGFEAAQEEDADLSGLTVVDDKTFTVELSQAWASFPTALANVAFAPIADECIRAGDLCASQPIGNGPFKVDDPWSPGDSTLKVVAWDDYIGERGDVTSVEYHFYSDPTFQSEDYLAGGVDVARLAADQVDDADPAYVHNAPTGSFRYLGMPVDAEGYGDTEFKRALSLAIDREAILDDPGLAHLAPADSYVPVGIPGGDGETCADCRHEAKEAVEYLDESDWPEGKDVEFAYPDNEPDSGVFLNAVCASVKETLDLGCETESMNAEEFAGAVKDNELPGAWAGHWIPDYAVSEAFLTPLYTEGNDFGYSQPEFENVLTQGNEAESLDSAIESYSAAEAMLDDDMPVIPFATGRYHLAFSKQIDPKSIYVDPLTQALQVDLLKVRDEE